MSSDDDEQQEVVLDLTHPPKLLFGNKGIPGGCCGVVLKDRQLNGAILKEGDRCGDSTKSFLCVKCSPEWNHLDNDEKEVISRQFMDNNLTPELTAAFHDTVKIGVDTYKKSMTQDSIARLEKLKEDKIRKAQGDVIRSLQTQKKVADGGAKTSFCLVPIPTLLSSF